MVRPESLAGVSAYKDPLSFCMLSSHPVNSAATNTLLSRPGRGLRELIITRWSDLGALGLE